MPALLEGSLVPGRVLLMPGSGAVLPLGELGLSIAREEPVLPAPEDMPLPGDAPPPVA